MPTISFAASFLRYFLGAISAHSLHSPFMYHLMTEAIARYTPDSEVSAPLSLRRQLLDDRSLIEVDDLGGGSRHTPDNTRVVKQLARHSGRRPRTGKLLYRLVRHFQPETMVELGTSLGIGTLFLKEAAPRARIVTIEGSETLAQAARRNISLFGASDVEVVHGAFAEVLTPGFIANLNPSLVVFDGDHREAPTLDYFDRFAGHARNDTVFIFDDIHWSPQMEKAWETIRNDERVRVTADLFTFGLVFFRKELSRQHFVLRNRDCF